jgi:hypothetical protein
MNDFKVGPFTASIHESTSTIVVTRQTDTLRLSTAECATAKSAVMMASSMFDVPVMPEYVAYTPFKLHFLPDGTTRLEKPEGGVFFGKADYEDLIQIIDMAVVSCADSLRIRGGARAGVRQSGPGDPTI